MDTRKPLRSFRSWRQISYNLAADLHLLVRIAQELEEDGLVSEGHALLRRLEDHAFSVAVVGEFKRGKSTFINALLGAEILPSDISPTTATINRVTFGLEPVAQLYFHDPDTPPAEVPVESLAEHVTKLTDASAAAAARVREAVIRYPVRFCKNDIDIIDTPGLGDEATMTAVTMRLLPEADAAIMVVMADSPFSETEGRFLEQLLAAEVSHILFVVTAMDRIRRERDRARVLDAIRARISQRIQRWTDENHPPGSPEHAARLSAYSDLRVYGLSALDALEARLEGNGELLAQSGLIPFEEALEHFLTSSDRLSLARRQQQAADFAQKIADVLTGRQAERSQRRMALRSNETHAALLDTALLALEQARRQREQALEEAVLHIGDDVARRHRLAFNDGLKRGLLAIKDRFSELIPAQQEAFTAMAADAVLEQLRMESQSAWSELLSSLEVSDDGTAAEAMVAARFTLAHVCGAPPDGADPTTEPAADLDELVSWLLPDRQMLLTLLRQPQIWSTLHQALRRHTFDRFLSLDFSDHPDKWVTLTERAVHQWVNQQPSDRPRQALQTWLKTQLQQQSAELDGLQEQVAAARKGLDVQRDREDALLEHEQRELTRHQQTVADLAARAQQRHRDLLRS